MYMYIYIYTSVDPCITCTESSGTEQCEAEFSGTETFSSDRSILEQPFWALWVDRSMLEQPF